MSYVGTNYHGWQIQNNANSVQEELNTVLSTMAEEEISTLGCGRTDTGVHALQYYCYFDSDRKMSDQNYLHRINMTLPNDIAVKRIFKVEPKAHVRFDVSSRTYEYWIHRAKSPFLVNRSYYLNYDLNLELMNDAAKILFEYKDFECFSKTSTQVSSFECEIMEAHWEVREDGLVFTIKANRFLRNMVRASVGSLIEIGKGSLTLEMFKEIIESKNRSEAGATVPAHALYLTTVVYPDIK